MRLIRPCRVLIVDDCKDTVDSTAMLLSLFGYQTVVAYTAAEAINQVAFKPDVALLDIGLPGKDGFELCAEMTVLLPDCVMIAVTGYGGSVIEEECWLAGFVTHLLKPVEDLEATIRAECAKFWSKPTLPYHYIA